MIDLCALIYIVYVHIEIHVLLKHLSLFLISDYESNILILYNNFQILKALIINMVIFINYLINIEIILFINFSYVFSHISVLE